MSDGKHCPKCKKDIGVGPVFSAGLPTMIKCPHCRARLRYDDVGLVLLVTLVIFAAVVAMSWFVSGKYGGDRVVFVGALLGVWTPCELAIAYWLRANKRLKPR